ncbi:CCA tRNA nucleotidyltransferase 1, mitochondrial [Ischnura elegans]|uniref:CCA tRNA nucleotidyltransferase 1, mitochondrial n=1 Tax=Ischnura elegans TaxID=197161 RepID=UPI001ED8686D|nr:CCA tRNA nucleotidyltransferase 1, mitochondrial [Ischnura elegans]
MVMVAFFRSLSLCRIIRFLEPKLLGNAPRRIDNSKTPLYFFVNSRYCCVKMKLDSPEFKAIFTPELEDLAKIFDKYGYEIRIAGGAVRDLLSGKVPNDLDFATTATPEEMKEMFTAENVRLINANGEKHGTITPRINDKENFEVTTLRIDEVTDGRHAQVKFTTDWKLDANRRDLTINSMFLGLDGTVYDYFNGSEDLKKKRVTFVGDARTRIQEDYLRILRYFRFYGRIAQGPNDHEEDTLKALQENLDGLNRISGERIWSELKKILSGNFAGEIFNTMLEIGIAPFIGLPSEPNKVEMIELWKRSKNYKLQPMTIVASLLHSEEEMMNFHARIKLSAYERDLGIFIVNNRDIKEQSNPLRQYQTLLALSKFKQNDVREWIRELLKYKGNIPTLEEFDQWKLPKFPINGNILLEKGVPGGKKMGPVLTKLKEYWIENDFKTSPEELMEKLPEVMNELDLNFNPNPVKKK